MGNQMELSGGRTKDAKFNFGKKGWRLVIMGILAYAVYMAFDNGLNYIVPAFSEKLNASPTTLLLFSSVGGWVSVVLVAVFGILIVKWGIKKCTILCMAIFCLAVIGWAVAPNVALYGVSAILVKSMGCVVAQLCFSEFGANWFPTKKGNYMGVVTVGVVVGGLLGNAIMGNVIPKAGVTPGIGIFAVLAVIVFVLICIFTKDNPEEAGAFPDNDKTMTPERAKAILAEGEAYKKNSPWTVAKCLKTGKIWLIGIGFGLVLLVAQGVIAQVTLICESYGLEEQVALMINILGAVFALVATLLARILDQKLGTKKASLICIAFAIAGCLIAALAGHAAVGMLIGIWLIFSAMSGGNNMLMSMTSTIWGRFDFSRPYTCILTISCLFSSFGYVALSAFADLTGGYFGSLIICTLLAVVASILILVTSDKYIGYTPKTESSK
ncbi:MAG: MFS transporter [Parasporobacterium sp.]|nr:MFS transporter [Parasporobacterium sp.]